MSADKGIYMTPTLKIVRFVVERGYSGSDTSKTLGLVPAAGDENIESRQEMSNWGNNTGWF